jgi:hypothetical protein
MSVCFLGVNSDGPAVLVHRLIVRLPSTSRSSAPKAKGLKKTRTRALSRAHKNIGNLKDEIETLRKRHKKIERLTKKIEHTKTAGPSELTPVKQTDIEIEQLNLTPNRKRFVRRKPLHFLPFGVF